MEQFRSHLLHAVLNVEASVPCAPTCKACRATMPCIWPGGCNVKNAAIWRKRIICALLPLGTHEPMTCRIVPGAEIIRLSSSRRSQCIWLHTKWTTSRRCGTVCVLEFSELPTVLLYNSSCCACLKNIHVQVHYSCSADTDACAWCILTS
jgi:hypothetical protein